MLALLIAIAVVTLAGITFMVVMLRRDEPVIGIAGLGLLQLGAAMSAVYGVVAFA